MLVNPVLSYRANNYKNINFAAKKKDTQENSNQRSTTSSLKAIPLATLVAMSPLNTANINASENADINEIYVENVQEDKVPKYKETIGFDKLGESGGIISSERRITYYSDKKDSKDIKSVVLTEDMGIGHLAYGEVKSIGRVKIQVVGDDGEKGESFEIPYVKYIDLWKDDKLTYTDDPKICTFLEKVVSGKDSRFNSCNVSKQPTTTLNVRMASSGNLLREGVSNPSVYQNVYVKQSDEIGDTRVVSLIEKSNGEPMYVYKIDTDGNPETFEKIAVADQKNYDQSRYAEVSGIQFTVVNTSPAQEHIRGTIVLKNSSTGKEACIIDKNLIRYLLEIAQKESFNNAFTNEIFTTDVRLKDAPDAIQTLYTKKYKDPAGAGAWQMLKYN